MAQPRTPTTALSSDDPQTTFEDVMAFIDGFDATTDLSTRYTTSAGDGGELLFSGFSSDTSDEDLLFAHSEELLGLLDATTPTVETTTEPAKSDAPAINLNCDTNTPPTAPSSEVSVGDNVKPLKEATRKRNAYREKMKRELQYLRLRAVEMEEQLTALRQGAVTALSPADKKLIDSSWERIAKHQLEARMESEAENRRLKSVLQGHVEMARAVEQSLGKRFVLEEELAAKPKTKRGRVTRMPWEDEGFTSLAGDLDATFDRLSHVMKDSGLDKVAVDSSRSFRMKTSVSASGVEAPYIELTDTAVAPFPPQLTAKAVWRSLLQQYFHQNREDLGVEKIWQTGNTFAAKCRSKRTVKTLGGQEMYLNCKIVLRKYIDEESRMVLVWRALNEGEGEHAGVYADETGWSVVQPLSGYCGLSTNGSIIRSCVHIVHRHRETSEVQDPLVGVLAELVVASNEEDMIWLTKSVENLLLDEVKSGAQGAESVV
ncbi:hypothetical protein Gpo141_00001959 [Globisporangium polare]